MHPLNIIPFSLEEVLASTGGTLLQRGRASFPSVGLDGRSIPLGGLFVAIRGERHDGHDFVAQAAGRGAGGALVQRGMAARLAPLVPGFTLIEVADTTAALGDLARARRQHPRFAGRLRVVGVTGSYGKTTTKNMLATLLGAEMEPSLVLYSAGNLNNHFGVPLTLLQLQAQHGYAVIEMGMSGLGEIAYLASLAFPEMGIITGVGPAHLEQLGTIENIARAKTELFTALPDGGVAIYPFERADGLLEQAAVRAGVGTRLRAVVVQREGDALLPGATTYCVLSEDLGGVHVRLRFAATAQAPAAECALHLPLLGAHAAGNAALAATAARLLGVPIDTIRERLEQVPTEKHRCQHTVRQGRHFLDDSYNANPQSARAAIQTLFRLQQGGRCWVVLGDMLELGPTAPTLHREVGAYLASFPVHTLVAVGQLAAEAAAAATDLGVQCERVTDAAAAADLLQKRSLPGDWILLKGSRGMALDNVLTHFAEDKT